MSDKLQLVVAFLKRAFRLGKQQTKESCDQVV